MLKKIETSNDKKYRDTNFIADLTLDLVETLNAVPGIQGVTVVARAGVERGAVSTWEQRHGVMLPSALRALYAATDGFTLTWNYSTAGKVLPLGNLEMHSLSRLARLGTGRGSGDPLMPSASDLAHAQDNHTSPGGFMEGKPVGMRASSDVTRKVPSTSLHPPSFSTSRMFEMDSCQGNGRVVLVCPSRGEQVTDGSIWFLDLSLRPHLIAMDLITYWRMMLVHLGMPQWHFLVAGIGLTPWAKQWYSVIAPHLLEGPKLRASQPDLLNRLDWGAFKTKKVNKKNNKETGSKESVKKRREEEKRSE